MQAKNKSSDLRVADGCVRGDLMKDMPYAGFDIGERDHCMLSMHLITPIQAHSDDKLQAARFQSE